MMGKARKNSYCSKASVIPVADRLVATVVAASARLGAVAGDVPGLAAVVALATVVTAGSLLGAVAGDVARVAALVAGLVARLGALALHVAGLAAVVA